MKTKKAYFGRFMNAEGTRNSDSFVYFSKKEAKRSMIEIAKGNCLESSSCEYYVTDDFSQTFYHGKVMKNNGKFSFVKY